LKPGNSGGGKCPHFWHTSEGDEEGSLAMSLAKPYQIRNYQRELYLKARAD